MKGKKDSKRSAAARRGWVTRRKKQHNKPKRTEYMISISYGQANNRIMFQIHITGPIGSTDDDAIKVVQSIAKGIDPPKSWTKFIIHYGRTKADKEFVKELDFLLNAALENGDIKLKTTRALE